MIRPMKPSDVPRVAEIHVFGQRTAYRGIVSDNFLFGKMTVEKRMEYFGSYKAEGCVYDDGIVKGFITFGPCEDEDKTGSFELYRIFVDPLMSGRGIGGKLAAHFEEVAIKRAYDEICLWVLEGNTKTRIFYEKLGYVPDGIKRLSGYFKVPEIRYIKKI